GVEVHPLAGGADEPVARTARVPRDERAARRDVHRHGLVGPVVDRRVVRLVVLALERDALTGPQRAHEVDRFPQSREALLELGPLLLPRTAEPDRDLVERLARA